MITTKTVYKEVEKVVKQIVSEREHTLVLTDVQLLAVRSALGVTTLGCVADNVNNLGTPSYYDRESVIEAAKAVRIAAGEALNRYRITTFA